MKEFAPPPSFHRRKITGDFRSIEGITIYHPLLLLLFFNLVCSVSSFGQIFDYRKCVDLSPTSGSAITLCEENPGFVPDLVLSGVTVSSQLPLVLGSSGYMLSNLNVHIDGTLFVDLSFTFTNCIVRLGPGAEIITGNNQILGGSFTQFFACNTMWRGIIIPAGSGGLSLFGCQIEDAEFAITLAEGVPLSMTKNTLNRNFVGLRNGDASTASPGLTVNAFFSNEFTWDEELNPPYPGQANHNNISFAGMHLVNTAGSFGFGFFNPGNFFPI